MQRLEKESKSFIKRGRIKTLQKECYDEQNHILSSWQELEKIELWQFSILPNSMEYHAWRLQQKQQWIN